MKRVVLTEENVENVKQLLSEFLNKDTYATYNRGIEAPGENFASCDLNRLLLLKGFKICGNSTCDIIESSNGIDFECSRKTDKGIMVCLYQGVINIPIGTVLHVTEELIYVYYKENLTHQCVKISLRKDEKVSMKEIKDKYEITDLSPIYEITLETNPLRRMRAPNKNKI